MRAITIHQPWCQLIADGHKTSETRSWAPPRPLIGKYIAIHAGRNTESLDAFPELYGFGRDLPLGAIVCVAKLAGAFRVTGHIEMQPPHSGTLAEGADSYYLVMDDYGNYEIGRWVWMLEDVRKLETPIPVKGHQGFWRVPEEQDYLINTGLVGAAI